MLRTRTPSDKVSSFMTWVDTVSPDEPPLTRWPRKIVRVLLICLKEMNKNVLTIRAGYLTYAILLSMVPMLAMSTAVVKGLGGGDQLREVIYTYVQSLEAKSPHLNSPPGPAPENSPAAAESSAAVPAAGEAGGAAENGGQEDLVGHLSSAVDRIFDYVDRTNFTTLGTFGMVGIFLSVIMVLGQVEKSLNVIWKVDAGRSFLRKVADYLALMVMMPISLNVALAASTMLKSNSLNVHVSRYLPFGWLQDLLLRGVPVLVLSVTLYAVYVFFPNTKTGGKATMVGALVAGTGWFITQNVYITMQIGVAKYNAIYGSFATIPLFLAWVWVGCLFVLIGAQTGYAIQIEPRYRFISVTPQPVLQISAALDICTLVGNRFRELKPTYREDIITHCTAYNQDLVDDVLEALVANDMLHYSRADSEIMPSRPPELLTNRKIVETALGEEIPDTPGGRTTLRAMTGIVESFPDEQIKAGAADHPDAASPAAEPQETAAEDTAVGIASGTKKAET